MALERRWLTIPEAAEAYGLHRKSLYILCKKRLIPYTRIPSLRGGRGQLRIDRRRFDEQLEAGEIVAERGKEERRWAKDHEMSNTEFKRMRNVIAASKKDET